MKPARMATVTNRDSHSYLLPEFEMAGDEDQPPYPTGLHALRDGWRLFQASPLLPHYPGTETQTAYLKYEFWFEQLVEVD